MEEETAAGEKLPKRRKISVKGAATELKTAQKSTAAGEMLF